ncbi:MAG: glutaredoxin family protein [Pseudoxanthomonas sp.]|nr:glutaredoxin family protein [Pseudoxanthomonas sp.]
MNADRRGQDAEATTLQLLLRPYCLLCLEAEHMLALAGVAAFERVDIERDPALEARYGTVIPVLRRADGAELAWPFSPAQVRALVAFAR